MCQDACQVVETSKTPYRVGTWSSIDKVRQIRDDNSFRCASIVAFGNPALGDRRMDGWLLRIHPIEASQQNTRDNGRALPCGTIVAVEV